MEAVEQALAVDNYLILHTYYLIPVMLNLRMNKSKSSLQHS